MLIDEYSSIEVPRVIQTIDIDTKSAENILTASNPLKNYRWAKAEISTINNDDNKLYTRMIKPSDFDSSKKYPALVYVYNGPHVQLVKNSWLGGAPMWMHWMAEQGYIVFTIDGRGSKGRSIEFEQAVHRQLGTLEMEDQIAGVKHLISLPYIDGDRLAVHGWSFGGFMTTSLMLRYPGIFKVGVAGGPVIDWDMYEIMYTERYMDTPEENQEGYDKARLYQYIPNLEGDLLMIHGVVDDVVLMQHSLEFVKQCVDAGVQMDYFVYPGHPHNVRGKDRVHLMEKVLKYVMDHL
jgi:dipeptidyl-peptidase-4